MCRKATSSRKKDRARELERRAGEKSKDQRPEKKEKKKKTNGKKTHEEPRKRLDWEEAANRIVTAERIRKGVVSVGSEVSGRLDWEHGNDPKHSTGLLLTTYVRA
jgi:hypothetical protein